MTRKPNMDDVYLKIFCKTRSSSHTPVLAGGTIDYSFVHSCDRRVLTLSLTLPSLSPFSYWIHHWVLMALLIQPSLPHSANPHHIHLLSDDSKSLLEGLPASSFASFQSCLHCSNLFPLFLGLDDSHDSLKNLSYDFCHVILFSILIVSSTFPSQALSHLWLIIAVMICWCVSAFGSRPCILVLTLPLTACAASTKKQGFCFCASLYGVSLCVCDLHGILRSFRRNLTRKQVSLTSEPKFLFFLI